MIAADDGGTADAATSVGAAAAGGRTGSLRRRALRLRRQLSDCAALCDDAARALPPGVCDKLRASVSAGLQREEGDAAVPSLPAPPTGSDAAMLYCGADGVTSPGAGDAPSTLLGGGWGGGDFGGAHAARAVCLFYRQLLLQEELRGCEWQLSLSQPGSE